MLINDTMEAMAEVSACKTKANCISLDAGPLQRVWCRPRKLGIPRGHLRGVLRISLWPCQWWTGIHYRWWHPGGSWQRPWYSSEGMRWLTWWPDLTWPDLTCLSQICFSAAGLGGVRTNWDAVLWQDRLYVSVTASQLADGSKRAFVSLLEYAEEELGVSNVVACVDK